MNKDNCKIGIFVMSCDRTSDVAKHFISAFYKYWPDCPFPIYFGINEIKAHLQRPGIFHLSVPSSGWKEESLLQLQLIRQAEPGITHLLVFLDDFIFNRKVDTNSLIAIAEDITKKQPDYLRLKRLEESWLGLLRQYVLPGTRFGTESCFEIRKSHPYYSSLQVAFWKIDHLEDFINRAGNIWTFEHLQNVSKPHFSVRNTFFHYRHVVEKGAWETGAARYCRKHVGWFEPGNRKMNSSSVAATCRFYGRKLIFFLLGYSVLEFRKWIKKQS